MDTIHIQLFYYLYFRFQFPNLYDIEFLHDGKFAIFSLINKFRNVVKCPLDKYCFFDTKVDTNL